MVPCQPADRLVGGRLGAPVIEERVEQIFTDVAAPERPVAVGGHDAARLRASERLDPGPHRAAGVLFHGFHGEIITDRAFYSLD
jgi:hypothetical protein